MTIKFFGMCIALATLSQCIQGSDLRHQLDRLKFDAPYAPYASSTDEADWTRRNNVLNKTSRYLSEEIATLPEGVVAIGAIEPIGRLLPLSHIRPNNGQCRISPLEEVRDFGQIDIGGILAFVEENYRKICKNRQDIQNHDAAEGLMTVQHYLSRPGYDSLYVPKEIADTLLRVDNALVVAKTPEDLNLFIQTLRDNEGVLERMYEEQNPEDLCYSIQIQEEVA
ncbi:MAG: hypothetical protein LBR89_02685 [Holosporales bacterium]|nr:hypothetical protein [Holosporales bacterium]